MSIPAATHNQAPSDGALMTARLALLLAISAGLAVAAIYYSQPMLGVLGADFNANAGAMGLVPTLTTLGYAMGILFLAPLGDRYDRRTIILGKASALFAALLLAASAPTLTVLLAASFAWPRPWRRTSCPPRPPWPPSRSAGRLWARS
jgi:MFS family permease